jgi:hypothetical protein
VVGEAPELLGDELAEQRLLRREVPVHRADPDPGAAGDLVHLRVDALGRERGARGLEDALAVAARVRAELTLGGARRGVGHLGHRGLAVLNRSLTTGE